MNNFIETISVIGGVVLWSIVLVILLALPIMLLWNWLMPVIFSLPEITFWQAFGLNLLISCLFRFKIETKRE